MWRHIPEAGNAKSKAYLVNLVRTCLTLTFKEGWGIQHLPSVHTVPGSMLFTPLTQASWMDSFLLNMDKRSETEIISHMGDREQQPIDQKPFVFLKF